MSEIFISYSSEDAKYALKLTKALEKQGLSVWLAPIQMSPGEDWFSRMVKAVISSQIMIVLLSKATLKSRWVRLEYRIAIGLNKPIIPIRLKKRVHIPKDLKRYQTLSDSPAVVSAIIGEINAMKMRSEAGYFNVSSRIWHELLANTLGIGIRIYQDAAAGDKVNVRTLMGALDLQGALLKQLNLYLDEKEDLNIIPINNDCGEIDIIKRNLILLGGPGGFPCVGRLLETWADACDHKENDGYRFVTDKRFDTCRHLRHSTGANDPLGIEDVQAGSRTGHYAIQESTNFDPGANFGVIYTKGLGEKSSGQKIVIVAPFNRSGLDGMLSFLTNKPAKCDAWLEQVRQCGDYSETLFQLRDVQGSEAEFVGHLDPRPLSCLI